MSGDSRPIRIRVLHLVPGLDVGGLEKLAVEFARWIDRDRFEPIFASLERSGRLGDEIRSMGFVVESYDKPPGLRPRMILKLARSIRRIRPRVVHTHNAGPLIYGALAARLASVPAVIHTRHHGRDHVIDHRSIALSRAASKLVDRVVCVSRDGARVAEEEGISSRRLGVIWNGIDVERFDQSGPIPSGPVVLVARLRPEKGIEHLIAAVSRIAASHPNLRVEIAGDGDMETSLRELVASKGLEDRITFLGHVEDVPALLRRASCLVLPSLTEGISLTLLEAMSRGLPVVTTRVGGSPEVVVDGETGLLVPPADAAALGAALARIHDDPAEARRMGDAGRVRAEQSFNVRRMIADYESLYREILEGKRTGEPSPRGGSVADLAESIK